MLEASHDLPRTEKIGAFAHFAGGQGGTVLV